MNDKRPIDRLRDSAHSIEIGAEDAAGNISEFYTIGDERLFSVHARAIYELILPDQTDPKRTNPSIPPVQRRVLAYGLDDEYVSRILFTAKTLFRKDVLPAFDDVRAASLSFEFLKEVIAMREAHDALQELEVQADARIKAGARRKDSLSLPSVPDIEARCKAFTQRAKDAFTQLNELAKVFHGDTVARKTWPEVLVALLASSEASQDAKVQEHLKQIGRFLEQVAEIRNAVVHPKPDYRFNVTDYRLGEDGLISPPAVELIHSKFPIGPQRASSFMAGVAEGMAVTFEDLAASMCSAKLEGAPGIPTLVVTLPEDRRRNRFVRYSYAAELRGQLIPML
ncbi:MAG: hypothetical protein ACT4O6_23475 [Reyranella sp.]